MKHQKASTDAVKGKLFTKAIRAIEVAVKDGGGMADPGKNFKLRLAIEQARAVNMPKDTIERAIARAAGEGEGSVESILYEAIGPGGAALLIEAATDNRQRTVAEIKNVLDRHNGRLAGLGAVSYQFQHVGYLRISKYPGRTLDEMVEIGLVCGADDVTDDGDAFEFFCKPEALSSVNDRIQKRGVAVLESTLIHKPIHPITLDDKTYHAVMTLIQHIDELLDVQEVYTNVS